MERAKNAIHNFLDRDGKHTTTVHQETNKAVTDEHIRPHEHENITTAIDKEVHQDHHHTIVQPLNVKETLPEKHTHKTAAVEHKTFEHGDAKEAQALLDQEAAKFKNKSVTHETTRTTREAPIVSGEHVHHHVHEHIQPVIQRETIQPHVVHTTVPVHETHHAAPIHHGTKVLPAKTLEEFTSGRGAGVVEGRAATKVKEFEGCPKIEHGTGRQVEGAMVNGTA